MITKLRVHELKPERRKDYVQDCYVHPKPFSQEEAKAIRELATILGVNALISLPDGAILIDEGKNWFHQMLMRSPRTRFIFGDPFPPTDKQILTKLQWELTRAIERISALEAANDHKHREISI